MLENSVQCAREILKSILFPMRARNTADTDLVDVVLEDAMLGFSWQGDLNVGESNVFNLKYTVPCDAEYMLTNTAVVWAQLNETTIYAEDSWTTDINYTKEEALAILIGANAKDATRMLAAQLIAAKLNRMSGASPCFDYYNETINIDKIIEEADSFLESKPLGSNPLGEARQEALRIKDLLDYYNNIGCD